MRSRLQSPSRARRAEQAVRESSFLPQGIADAADRLDQARLAPCLGLAAQIADVHVERVRAEAEVVAPHALKDDRSRQHLTRVQHEELEQRELRARELDLVVAAMHLARRRVEVEVGEAQRLDGAVRGTPEQRTQPREQLLEREWLYDVVVRAGVETGDAV